MLPNIQPGNTKILYFFNCLLDGMHTILFTESVSLPAANQNSNSIMLLLQTVNYTIEHRIHLSQVTLHDFPVR